MYMNLLKFMYVIEILRKCHLNKSTYSNYILIKKVCIFKGLQKKLLYQYIRIFYSNNIDHENE